MFIVFVRVLHCQNDTTFDLGNSATILRQWSPRTLQTAVISCNVTYDDRFAAICDGELEACRSEQRKKAGCALAVSTARAHGCLFFTRLDGPC